MKFGELIRELEPLARLRWSPVENLHITTRFIGEWSVTQLPELAARLKGIKQTAQISITLRGLGFFTPNRPRVFWAGVEHSPALHSVAAATDTALAELGLASERRHYSPHLTLARIPGAAALCALRDRIQPIESLAFGSFEAMEFHLYESRASLYNKLHTFPLK